MFLANRINRLLKKTVVFKDSDFPEAWTCIPFVFKQSYIEYNPEGKETRMIPGFISQITYRRCCCL